MGLKKRKKRPLTVRIDYDHDLENPCDYDCQWRVHSFGRRHKAHTDPADLGLTYSTDSDGMPIPDDSAEGRELTKKLQSGLAFYLSYFEHSTSWWGVYGAPVPAGVEFRWDGVRIAGLLVWPHAEDEIGGKTYDERMADAVGFIAEYTSWCNGEGYCYSIEDSDGNLIDSCGGFLGNPDYMLRDNIAPHLKGRVFKVTGDADHLESDLLRIMAELTKATRKTTEVTEHA